MWTMKKRISFILRILILTAIPVAMVSCNNEDDIKAIFIDQTWYITYVKDGDTMRYPKQGKIYSIDFKDNGIFEARTPGGAAISGNWNADGSNGKHTFGCSNIRTTGSFSGDTIAEKMYGIIRNAKKYSGDIHWLQIIQDNNAFMLLYNR